MENKNEITLILEFFLLISGIIFWRYDVNGEYLLPGNYLVAFFSPYQAYNFDPIGNKPVADDVFWHIYTFKVLDKT